MSVNRFFLPMMDHDPLNVIHPDPLVVAVTVALLDNDGRRHEQVEQPWIWRDEAGEDLSYLRAAIIAVDAIRALATDEEGTL